MIIDRALPIDRGPAIATDLFQKTGKYSCSMYSPYELARRGSRDAGYQILRAWISMGLLPPKNF
jgi:hypothetical protein